MTRRTADHIRVWYDHTRDGYSDQYLGWTVSLCDASGELRFMGAYQERKDYAVKAAGRAAAANNGLPVTVDAET